MFFISKCANEDTFHVIMDAVSTPERCAMAMTIVMIAVLVRYHPTREIAVSFAVFFSAECQNLFIPLECHLFLIKLDNLSS